MCDQMVTDVHILSDAIQQGVQTGLATEQGLIVFGVEIFSIDVV